MNGTIAALLAKMQRIELDALVFIWSMMRYDQYTQNYTSEQLLSRLNAGEPAKNRWTRVSEWLYRTADPPETQTQKHLDSSHTPPF